MSNFSDYIIYVDESGDHNLEQINPEYPLFVLAFVIFKKDILAEDLAPRWKKLKFEFWGHDDIVLHEHEIRKPKGHYAFLQKEERRSQFMATLSSLMAEVDYTVAASVIQKAKLSKKYLFPENPYHIALGLCMERAAAFLHAHDQGKKTIPIIAEGRGNKEDRQLELEFRRVLDGAAVLDFNLQDIRYDLRIVPKAANLEGLQLADLIARPIGRKILDWDQENRAYDIIRTKFKGAGLKTFP